MAEAAAVVGRVARRAWLTVGAGEIGAFAAISGVHFLVRLVEPPVAPLPLRGCEVIVGRGPVHRRRGARSLRTVRHRCARREASGGAATEAKLAAARRLGLPGRHAQAAAARARNRRRNHRGGARLARRANRFHRERNGVMKGRLAIALGLAALFVMTAAAHWPAPIISTIRRGGTGEQRRGAPPDPRRGRRQAEPDRRRTAHRDALCGGQRQYRDHRDPGQGRRQGRPTDLLGNTPLHLAADRGRTEAAELLLAAGALVDPQNHDGRTPLMLAASRGDTTLVLALLAKGASTTIADYTGRNALAWAEEGRHAAAIAAIKRAEKARGS